MGGIPETHRIQANDRIVRAVLNPTVQWHLHDTLLCRHIRSGKIKIFPLQHAEKCSFEIVSSSHGFVQDVGTDINAFTVSIFVGVTRFCMSLFNAWLLKRFRRRALIMVSSLGMAACMFVSGLVTYWIKQGETGLGWVRISPNYDKHIC